MIFTKFLLKLFLFGYVWNYLTSIGVAQIIPDDSLGRESSIVTPDITIKNVPADYLQGGAVRGNNLFHSFVEFNILPGGAAYFASYKGIDNIFTRVTGNNLSDISGRLGVDGDANLFLLNPHGIIFGQNSQLDLAGSFLATTGESLVFDNGFGFSATNPQAPPLLTVNMPLGLQFGSDPRAIVNRSHRLPETDAVVNDPLIPEGLRIAPEQTLSLIGGEVVIEGGYLNTSKGTIELGGVGANNTVELASQGDNWQTDYTGINIFKDIKIRQQGGIDGGVAGGSRIDLIGKNISLGYDSDTLAELDYQVEDFLNAESLPKLNELNGDRVQILAHNRNNERPSEININAFNNFSIIDPGNEQQNIAVHTSGSGSAGKINIAAKSVIMYGASLESWTLAGATGNSGEINFQTQNMSIHNGGAGVNTFGSGRGGAIDLNLTEDLVIKSGGLGAVVRGSGNGGTIKINARNLEISVGGLGIGTFGAGNGGTIELNIANRLKVNSGGFGADALDDGSGGTIKINARNLELLNAGAGANTRGRGKGGEIQIEAETILFRDGIIGAESGQNPDERNFRESGLRDTKQRNAGDGGNILIEAQNFLIDNGNVSTSTIGTGNAGNIALEIGTLEIIGSSLLTGISSSTDGGGSGGNVTVNVDRLKLSDGATVAANATDIGRAGNIRINALEVLQLEDNGAISVDGGMAGFPGNIDIKGKDINLNRGTISATTNRGTQGNIRLTGRRLFLSDRATIATNASGNATGGNIFIELDDTLVGLNNSQIAARAERGQGGNIQINTRGIFLSPNSQIDANSNFGIDGLIQIQTLAVTPNSGLIELSSDLISSGVKISRDCSLNRDNQFVNVGKGGLPENPLTSVSQNITLPDWGMVFSSTESADLSSKLPSVPSNIEPVVEAQNWKINRNGKIELFVASNQTNTVLPNANCGKDF